MHPVVVLTYSKESSASPAIVVMKDVLTMEINGSVEELDVDLEVPVGYALTPIRAKCSNTFFYILAVTYCPLDGGLEKLVIADCMEAYATFLKVSK